MSSTHSEQAETEPLTEEQRLLKINVLTYRNLAIDRRMVQYRPRPKAIPKTVPLGQIRESLMGRFNILPVEITNSILEHLDFRSLENMMRVNSSCKAIVESLPAYRDMIRYASGTVQALISTGLVQHFTVGQLHDTLRTDRCEGCGKFGPFLFLLTCTRRCYACISQDPQFRVMTVSAAKVCFGVTTGDLKQLPILKSSPQLYAKPLPNQQRLLIVNHQQARALGVAAFGGEEIMLDHVQKSYDVKRSTYDRNKAAWRESGSLPENKPLKPQSLLNCTIDDSSVASTLFPTLNVSNRYVQWGMCCRGCWNAYIDKRDNRAQQFAQDDELRIYLTERRDRHYNHDEFLEHFEQCESAKHLWIWRSIPAIEGLWQPSTRT